MNIAYVRAFLIFLFIGISFVGSSQVLENYNPAIQEMYPETLRKSNTKIQVKLDLETFPNSTFRFVFPGKSTMFLEDKLWFQTATDTVFIIPLAGMKNFFSGSDSTGTMLTIIKSGINSSNVSVEKGFFENEVFQSTTEDSEIFLPEKRAVDNFNDFFFFAVIGILFLISVYKLIYPLVLKLILMPTSVFSAEDFSESNSVQKFFSLDVIFYLLMMNMMAFLLLMLCVKAVGNESLQFIVSGDLNQHFLSWLLGSSILILIAVLKFTLLRFLGFVFDLKKNSRASFFLYVKDYFHNNICYGLHCQHNCFEWLLWIGYYDKIFALCLFLDLHGWCVHVVSDYVK